MAVQSLVDDFVSCTLPLERPSLLDADRRAADDVREARKARRPPDDMFDDDQTVPLRTSLDVGVLKSAFSWAVLEQPITAAEGREWQVLVADLLDLALRHLPAKDARQVRSDRYASITGEFEDWVLRLVAIAPFRMESTGRPHLWKRIIDLPRTAHYWVDSFLDSWFTYGSRLASSAGQFVAVWTAMIEHALDHADWKPTAYLEPDLGLLVAKILGTGPEPRSFFADDRYKSEIGDMLPTFRRAAERWLTMPEVAGGLSRLVIQPAAQALLLPSLEWLSASVPKYDEYTWEHWSHGLADSLVHYLRVAWLRERAQIASEPAVRNHFLQLLSNLSGRGVHAARQLSEEVVGSLGEGR
jgi:hypothetical protein